MRTRLESDFTPVALDGSIESYSLDRWKRSIPRPCTGTGTWPWDPAIFLNISECSWGSRRRNRDSQPPCCNQPTAVRSGVLACRSAWKSVPVYFPRSSKRSNSRSSVDSPAGSWSRNHANPNEPVYRKAVARSPITSARSTIGAFDSVSISPERDRLAGNTLDWFYCRSWWK